EDANLRKALAWCKAEPRAGQAGLRMATALLYHWFLRDSFPEGGSWLRNMLARTDSTDRSIVRGHAITGLGWAQWFEGDYDAAATSAEEAVSIARENGGAKYLLTEASKLLGVTRTMQRRYEVARHLLEESLALAKELGNVWNVGASHLDLANVAYLEGDL